MGATLHGAVLGACDTLEGEKDGQIGDPRACRFNPGTIACRAGASAACLTPLQVDVARRFYRGPVDARGRHLCPGGEPYGAELTWTGRGSLTEAGATMLDENVRTMMFLGTLPKDVTLRNWNWKWDVPTLRALQQNGALYVEAAALLDGGKVRRRPVFAYPVRATHDGHGDVDATTSFIGRTPAAARDDHDDWAGSATGRR